MPIILLLHGGLLLLLLLLLFIIIIIMKMYIVQKYTEKKLKIKTHMNIFQKFKKYESQW